MNKTELKKILKPLIKQCIKEVIFEDGTLSNIVSEVARGLSDKTTITETRLPQKSKPRVETDQEAAVRVKRKKMMLDAIGKDAYNGVDVFAGTTPAPAPVSEGQGKGPLSDVAPHDPGVDISGLFGSKAQKLTERLIGKE